MSRIVLCYLRVDVHEFINSQKVGMETQLCQLPYNFLSLHEHILSFDILVSPLHQTFCECFGVECLAIELLRDDVEDFGGLLLKCIHIIGLDGELVTEQSLPSLGSDGLVKTRNADPNKEYLTET